MKKFDLKSIFMGVVAGIIVTCGVSIASSVVTGDVYFSSYPIYLNGSYYASTSPVLNYNGRTYLPLNELGTALGSTVTFNNNAIYINNYNNYNNNYNSSYNSSSNNYYTETREEDIELEKGESETYYVSLARYSARSATVTGSNSYVKVSKTKFTSSGDLKITGSKEGEATIKITYNTGDVEKLYVEVTDDDEYEDEVSMETGDTYKVYIDLDDYDADEAKITYDSNYVKVSKTKFTSDGYLTITAKKEGDTTVKIKYDSGDTVYIDIEIDDDDDDDEEEVSMDVGDTHKVYIDLDDYDADEAKITYDSNYVKVSKTKFTSDGYLTITAKKEGDTTVKIKYDSGDTVYIDIEIDDDDDYRDNYDEVEIEEDEYEYVYIDLDEFDATSATLTYNNSYIKLDKTTLTSNGKVKITGKNAGYTSIKVKFNTGDIVYIDVEVSE